MICPISCEVMKDPVMAMDGHTYERVCIEEWFGTGARTSPATNEPLETTTLLPNHMARSLISVFLEQCRQSQASAAGELPPEGIIDFHDLPWRARWGLQLRLPGYDWSAMVSVDVQAPTEATETVRLRPISTGKALRVQLRHRAAGARSRHPS